MAELDKLYSDAEHGALPVPLAELRRNVGRERFAAVVHALVAAAVGHPQDTAYSSEELEGMLNDAFRLSDKPSNDAPTSDKSVNLEAFSKILIAHSAVELANADIAELNGARHDMRALITFVTAGASLLSHFAGRDSPSLGAASRMFNIDRPRQQMHLLLGGLALRTSPELRTALKQTRTALAPQALAANQMYGLLGQLREHVPALADALSDTRLSETLQNGAAPAAVQEEIKRVRDDDPRALDAFFETHPEADELIATFEKHRDRTSDRRPGCELADTAP